MTPHLYDRLTGPEKAALTRQWKSYSKAIEVAYFPRDKDEPLVELRIAALRLRAQVLATAAAKREAYLFAIETTWFRLLWQTGETPPLAKLPAEYFEDGQDLDDILWEEHPVNLFQALEEEAGL